MSMRFYKLVGDEPVPDPDMDSGKWIEWLQTDKDRIIKKDFIGAVEISTVFLGFDYTYGSGNLKLFETAIFNDGMVYTEVAISSTKAEALIEHSLAVALVLSQQNNDK